MTLENQSCKLQTNLCKLDKQQVHNYLTTCVPEWSLAENGISITRHCKFKNFKQTMFFVNAVAYLCEKEGHHPDIKLGFGYCSIEFTTHDIGGLSINDFICATKIDKLYQ